MDSNTNNNAANGKSNTITANDDAAYDKADTATNESSPDQSASDTIKKRTGTAAVVIVVVLVAIILVVFGMLYRKNHMQPMLPEDPDVHITGNKAFENPQYGDALQGKSRRASGGSGIAAALAAAQQASTRSRIEAAAAVVRAGGCGANTGQPLYRPVYDLTGGGSSSGTDSGPGNSGYYARGGGNGSAVVYSTPADFSSSADYAGVSYEPAGTASATNTQLYAIPMEGAADNNTGAGAGAINLPRGAVGTVVLDAASGAYEVVSAANGIYAPAAEGVNSEV